MPQKRISIPKIKRLILLYSITNHSNSEIGKMLKISKTTTGKYINLHEKSGLGFLDINKLTGQKLIIALGIRKPYYSRRYELLLRLLPVIHQKHEKSDLKSIWQEYKYIHPSGYGYSQFVLHYNIWRNENSIPKVVNKKCNIPRINEADIMVLNKWRSSSSKRRWERAVALLDLNNGVPISKICKKIERSPRTIKSWLADYETKGLNGLDLHRRREVDKEITDKIKEKKERLIKLLHQTPHLYDINRTSWSLKTLAETFGKVYGKPISKSSISEYIRSEGYTFKKARKTLTSPDPQFREKVAKITDILSHLGPKGKFFSIDEFGPFAIKIRGGRTYVHENEVRTIPQRQKSRGSLICTAALELATNQITHFYSNKKNTDEMIKLLKILLNEYNDEECIYFSWDSASWHASKKLYEKVEKVNSTEYRQKNRTPIVKLAPLPTSAQFLNVIESVFSGMAKAVLHNSDYQTVSECKYAIDFYFSERNKYFINNPKRAGKKIWGNELVKPAFKESNICKDKRWR